MRTVSAILLVFIVGVCRADTFAYVSLAKDRKIAVYKIEPFTGALTHVADASCEGEPGAPMANPARSSLFASLRPEGKIVAYRIDPLTGALQHLNTFEAGPDPAHLSTDKDGRFLLAVYYVAGKVTVHAIESDGSLRVRPVQSVPTAEKAHAILLDPTNRFAFVPHTGPNAIFQFAFNAATGEFTPGSPPKLATPQNTGPKFGSEISQLAAVKPGNEKTAAGLYPATAGRCHWSYFLTDDERRLANAVHFGVQLPSDLVHDRSSRGDPVAVDKS